MLTVELVESGLDCDSFDDMERGLRMGAWEEPDEFECLKAFELRGVLRGLGSAFLIDKFENEDELDDTIGSSILGFLITTSKQLFKLKISLWPTRLVLNY